MTTLACGLIKPCRRLDYLPPRASLNTSSADHPENTKSKINVHVSRQESTSSTITKCKDKIPKLVTSKGEILAAYSDVFNGIGQIPGPPYHIQVDPSVTSKQTTCQPVLVHLKESFKQEIDKILQVGVLKPVNHATLWINSFVLVEGKDNLGNLKLGKCLDPTNLNKAIVHEVYHFRTPEDIAHHLAEAWVITICD